MWDLSHIKLSYLIVIQRKWISWLLGKRVELVAHTALESCTHMRMQQGWLDLMHYFYRERGVSKEWSRLDRIKIHCIYTWNSDQCLTASLSLCITSLGFFPNKAWADNSIWRLDWKNAEEFQSSISFRFWIVFTKKSRFLLFGLWGGPVTRWQKRCI